jgi:hypothetical protein
MLQHHYLPTLVNDRRTAFETSARRHRLLAGVGRREARQLRRTGLTLAASAVRTTADATTPRAA